MTNRVETTTNHSFDHGFDQLSDETKIYMMRKSISVLEEKMEKFQNDKDRALVWGIRTLGGLLLALALWVYSMVPAGRH